MVQDSQSAVQLQAVIEKAIAKVSELDIARPVAIVAEFPAHLPPVFAEEAAIVGALAEVLESLLSRTRRQEVRIRAQVAPAGPSRVEFQNLPPDAPASPSSGPWALISISDLEAPESEAVEERPDQDEPLNLKGCQEAIRPFRGIAWSEQTAEPGWRVWIALPLGNGGLVELDLARIQQALQARAAEGSPGTLLLHVVDTSLRTTLSQLLQREGYQVVEAGKTSEVLGMARAVRPDLIILDLQARIPSALEVALLLLKDRDLRATPVLFLTEVAEAGAARRVGVVDFLPRPEGTGAILRTIQAMLRTGLKPATRVMVVEADDALREQLLLRIQAQGHPVAEARSPEEALALAERVPIGVVLANARLAQERDYWLLRQLKALRQEIDVYVMAEALSEEEARTVIRRGAAGVSQTGKLPDLLKREDAAPGE